MIRQAALFVLTVLATAALHAHPSAPADRSHLVRFHSPTLGDPQAKVELVEFFDPACEACRAVYPHVKRLMAENPGRIRLVIRYAPFHKDADQIVRLLEAAKRQGKFWPTLEMLLATQSEWAINHVAKLEFALKAVSRVGLDMRRVEEDMRSPALTQLIEQDRRDLIALKVSGTPEFFLNGRPLVARSLDDLRKQIEQAVRAAYP